MQFVHELNDERVLVAQRLLADLGIGPVAFRLAEEPCARLFQLTALLAQVSALSVAHFSCFCELALQLALLLAEFDDLRIGVIEKVGTLGDERWLGDVSHGC